MRCNDTLQHSTRSRIATHKTSLHSKVTYTHRLIQTYTNVNMFSLFSEINCTPLKFISLGDRALHTANIGHAKVRRHTRLAQQYTLTFPAVFGRLHQHTQIRVLLCCWSDDTRIQAQRNTHTLTSARTLQNQICTVYIYIVYVCVNVTQSIEFHDSSSSSLQTV